MTGPGDVVLLLVWVLFAGVLAVAVLQVVLLARAARVVARHRRRVPFSGREDTYRSPLTPAVTVVLPVHGERDTVVDAVHALLALRYPTLEIVVVDDGSTDDTVAVLEQAFGLREYPRVVPADVPTRSEVRAVLAPSGSSPLAVVCTPHAGRSSAVNTGINAARHPLVCVVEADSLLDPEALLAVARPFTDDPEAVVASGAGVRVANGSRVEAGRVLEARMPRGLLGAVQVVEHLRTFVLGRAASSSAGALALPGAFRLLRRDVVVEVGGVDLDAVGAEAELVVRMHRHLRAGGRAHRMVFVAEPVVWARVPATPAAVAAQCRRGTAGLVSLLRRHRELLLSPRHGALGAWALPVQATLEVTAPVLELASLAAVLVALAVGAVDGTFALLFVLTVLGAGLLLSLAALAVEELAFPRSAQWGDLSVAVTAAVVAPLVYRPVSTLWRVAGVVDGLRAGAGRGTGGTAAGGGPGPRPVGAGTGRRPPRA